MLECTIKRNVAIGLVNIVKHVVSEGFSAFSSIFKHDFHQSFILKDTNSFYWNMYEKYI